MRLLVDTAELKRLDDGLPIMENARLTDSVPSVTWEPAARDVAEFHSFETLACLGP